MTKNSLTNKIISIGIDVGTVNGAISIVDEDLKILLLSKIPTYQTLIKSKRNKSKLNKETLKFEKDYRKRNWVDFKKLGEIIKPFVGNKIIYTIEKIASRPNEGEAASFLNGNSLGIFEGMYSFINPVAFYEPTPIIWKKEMGVTSDKTTSIELSEDIFQVKLKDYLPRGKVDDIAEALLLAFYGLRRYIENKEN